MSDKEKYSEKFQHLLNNCCSGNINQYIFEKNPELLTIDLEKYKYLIVLDIYKTDDFVMLDILDQFIQNDPYFTNSEKEEWKEELKDFRVLNMDISDNIIDRSQGISQGSELAPYLFNYYMSRILEDPTVVGLLTDCEITIYADNISIVNNFDNEEMCRKFVVDLNNAFNKYNLSFKSEYKIIKIAGFGFRNEPKKIDELDNYQSIKLLDMKFSPINYPRKSFMMLFNFKEASFKLKYNFFNTDYKLIYFAKRYVIFGSNSYNSLWYTKYLERNYKDWIKRELRNWLKANLLTVKISDIMIEHIIGNREIFSNFYWFNIEFKFENNAKISNDNYILINNNNRYKL